MALKKLEDSAETCSAESPVEGAKPRSKAVLAYRHSALQSGLLNGVPEEKVPVVLDAVMIEPRKVSRDEYLVLQGERGDSLFLALSGLYSCRVNGREVRQFGPGQMFGEVVLCASFPDMVLQRILRGREREREREDEDDCESSLAHAVSGCCERTADVACVEAGEVVEIPAERMAVVFRVSEEVFDNIFEKAERRFLEAVQNDSLEAILRCQAHSRLFRDCAAGGGLPGLTRRKSLRDSDLPGEVEQHPLMLAGMMRGVPLIEVPGLVQCSKFATRRVGSGDSIVTQGTQGESMFVVLSGKFSCRINGIEVKSFGPCQLFGEVLLCSSFPELVHRWLEACREHSRLANAVSGCSERTADVVCVEEGDVAEFTAEGLAEAFRRSEQLFSNVLLKATEQFLEAVACGSLDAIIRYQAS